MIRFNIDDKKLKAVIIKYDAINKPDSHFLKQAMMRLGANQNRWTKRRLAQGLGIKGKLKPYSPGYAEYRREHHRPVDKVNLNYTGNYWKSFGIQYRHGAVIVGPGIGNAIKLHSDIGIKHDRGIGRLPRREHIGFTASDVKNHLRNFGQERKSEIRRIQGTMI